MDDDARGAPEGNGTAAVSNGPAPIEWAVLVPNGEHGGNGGDLTQPHDFDLPSWVPPPPGSLAARLKTAPPPLAHAHTTVATIGPDIPHTDSDDDDEDDSAFADLTVGEVLSSRGARVLAVVAVCTLIALVATSVVLWQRIENVRVKAQREPAPSVVERQLSELRRRMTRVETQAAGILDATGTVTTTPAPLLWELGLLRKCVRDFQQALDDGRSRFTYC
jgi:hypothetical protein